MYRTTADIERRPDPSDGRTGTRTSAGLGRFTPSATRSAVHPPGWWGLLAAALLVAALPLTLWTVDNPAIGVIAVGFAAGLAFGLAAGRVRGFVGSGDRDATPTPPEDTRAP